MYGACGPHAIVRSVRSFLVLVSLGLLVLAGFGCGEPEAPKGSPAARDGVDRTQQYAEDVATWENAVGKTHGLTPKEIHEIMNVIRDSPVFKNTFLGVKTIQLPTDAWIIQEILYEVKPDLIVETGAFKGGSAAL